MVKFKAVAIGALALLPVVGVHAADAARAPVIVSVDVRGALANTNEAKTRFEKLKASLAGQEQEFKQARDAEAKLEEQYKKDSAVMSADQRRTMEKQIEDKRFDLQVRQKKLEKNAQDGQQEIGAAILPKIEKAVKALVEERKYDIVVHRETAVFVAPQFDITQDVIARVNDMK